MTRLIGGSDKRTIGGAVLAVAGLLLFPSLAVAAAPGPASAAVRQGGTCGAFGGARQLPGADGVSPAAWSGGGLIVPACGPIPNDGGSTAHIRPYPGALWTPGYQCVEFSERYLYYRYGVTMDISTNGDQVAAHYAAKYPRYFTIVKNGTPHHAPAAGDVLSMSTAPGFASAAGGHTAVVQASDVTGAGNGTVTIVEENAVPSGVEVLPVTGWAVRYGGFAYIEWLSSTQSAASQPAATVTPEARQMPAAVSPAVYFHDAATGALRQARWTSAGWRFTTIDGTGSTAPGHTSGDVGAAASAVVAGGQPSVFYSDTTSGSLRAASFGGGRWHLATLDGPGATTAGHTGDRVGSAVSAVAVNGRVRVFYSDTTAHSLRLAVQTGSGWRIRTLDGPGSKFRQHTWHHVGAAISALLLDGRPEVFYADTSTRSLHRAWWTGKRWLFLTIDGPSSLLRGHTAGLVGSAVSAAVLHGIPQVFYADATTGSLRHARLTRAGWRFQTLDGGRPALAGHTADRVGPAVAVTQMNGNAQVYYYDASRRSLRHAWWTGRAWRFETLDGAGSGIAGHDADEVGSAVSVTEMTSGPQVYYYDATRHSLRHAWWTPGGWRFQILDGPGSPLSGHTGDPVGTGVAVAM